MITKNQNEGCHSLPMRGRFSGFITLSRRVSTIGEYTGSSFLMLSRRGMRSLSPRLFSLSYSFAYLRLHQKNRPRMIPSTKTVNTTIRMIIVASTFESVTDWMEVDDGFDAREDSLGIKKGVVDSDMPLVRINDSTEMRLVFSGPNRVSGMFLIIKVCIDSERLFRFSRVVCRLK